MKIEAERTGRCRDGMYHGDEEKIEDDGGGEG